MRKVFEHPDQGWPFQVPRDVVITVHADLPSEMLGNIRRTLTAAAASLDLDEITVRVGETARLRRLRLIAAVTTEQEIVISEQLLSEDGVYAAATLLEEAAHLKLMRSGVEQGFDSFGSTLIHESYATWYVFWELMKRVPLITERFEDGPIPSGDATPDLGYRLGAFVGAAAAGVPAARTRVGRFNSSGLAPTGVKSLAARVQQTLEAAEGPPEAAMALARVYSSGTSASPSP